MKTACFRNICILPEVLTLPISQKKILHFYSLQNRRVKFSEKISTKEIENCTPIRSSDKRRQGNGDSSRARMSSKLLPSPLVTTTPSRVVSVHSKVSQCRGSCQTTFDHAIKCDMIEANCDWECLVVSCIQLPNHLQC